MRTSPTGARAADRARVRPAARRRLHEHAVENGGAFRDEELHLWRLGADRRVAEFRHYLDTAKHVAAARGGDTRR